MKKRDDIMIAPHSAEAEQALLGGLMLDPAAWLSIDDTVKAEHFFRTDHQLIFGAIAALAGDKKPSDPVTVSELLDRRKKLKDAGGLQYLGALTRDTPGATNARHYAQIVFDRWQARQAMIIGNQLVAAAGHDEKAPDKAIQALMKLSHKQRTTDGILGDEIGPFIDELDEMYSTGSRPPGVMSGLKKLDAQTGGFARGQLTVVGGRPAMGKTTFALNVAAFNPTMPIGMMSGEQPRRELIRSMIAMVGDVSAHAMRLGKVTEPDWPKITVAAKMLRDSPFYVNDAPSPHIDEIFRQARKWKHYHNIQLLISDYLQRQNGPGDKRHEQVEAIVRGHKEIARELDIPVLLLAQIGREVEKRDDKRPQMADFRDSGAIEQEADLLLTLYRDEVYYGRNSRAGEAEIAALKNRHGPTGVVVCKFTGATLKFSDYEFDGGDFPEPSTDDLPLGGPPGGNGTDRRQVENRRGPYRRSSSGG